VELDMSKRTEIVEQCNTAALQIINDKEDKDKKIITKVPCKRIEGTVCSTYLYPNAKWRNGSCPFAERVENEALQHKLNPLKASKRAQTGKG
jgi:hypothetical protein